MKLYSLIKNLMKINCFKDLKSLLIRDDLAEPNLTFSGKIINCKPVENSNFLNLNIRIGEESCDEFVSLQALNSAEAGDDIEFDSNKIKISVLNNKNYVELINPAIKKNKNKNKANDKLKVFNFDIFKFVYSYNDIAFSQNKENYIFSIILKVKQFDNKKHQYEFYDIYGEKVPLDYSTIKNKIEGQKIFIFNSFRYIKDSNDFFLLTPSKYSTIQEIDENNVLFNKDIQINDDNIISFIGVINDFKLENNKIELFDEQNRKYYAILNNRLFKKLEIECLCKFQCFINLNKDRLLKMTEFSDIIPYQKTIILFKCIKSIKEKDYYNQIIIDNIIKDIENKDDEIKFELPIGNTKKNILVKTIKLKKKDDIKEEVSYRIEINKGKENKSNIYLGKDGRFSYQLYYQTINDDFNLHDDFNLIINNETFKFSNFDYFKNRLKKRMTFINIPTELYKTEEFSLNKKDANKNNSIKILKLINEKETEYKFNILPEETKMKNIEYNKLEIDKDYELINSFYNEYFKEGNTLEKDHINIKKNSDNKYHNLFYGQKKIENFKNYINKELKEYNFQNNERDYLFVKKLCFSLLYYGKRNGSFKIALYNYITFIKSEINYFNNLEFIERINCLISLTKEYLEDNNIWEIKLVSVEDENNEEFKFVIDAHKLFLGIIDELTENSSLFQIIHQFNSMIYNELESNEAMYSGSILNLKDVQLEIYKNLNSFYFCSPAKKKLYASIYNCTKVTILYYNEFSNDKIKESEQLDKINKRMSAAVLLVLFHELGGHLKTHINNESDSPRRIYLNDLNVKTINLKKNDSGFLLEYLFVKGSIEVKNFVNSDNSEQLLNKNIYIGSDFIELNKILNTIKNSVSKTPEPNVDLIKQLFSKGKISTQDKKNILKFDYKSLNYQQLTALLSEMDDKTFDECKEIYEYYLSTYFSNPNKKC